MELKTYFAQDIEGNVLPNADVTVYFPAGQTVTLATLFDANNNLLTNPFQAGEDGLIQFAAANGRYDVKVASGVRVFTISNVQLQDFDDAVAAVQLVADEAESAKNYVVSVKDRIGLKVWDQFKYRVDRQRIDFIGIGDSNLVFNGTGWDHGLQFALSQSFPMYATGLISMNEGGGNGAGLGFGYGRRGAGASYMPFIGAPVELSKYLNGGLSPAFYGYLADGSSKTDPGIGMSISATSPIDISANLRYDLWYGTFDSGAGSINLSARLGVSPFSTLSTSDPISTNTGVLGNIAKDSLTLAAASRSQNLEFLTSNNSRSLVGPFFGTYQRLTNTDRLTGFSWNTMSFRGGQTLRDHANAFINATDDELIHYLQAVRDGQSAQLGKMFIFTVNSGLNERNELAGSTSLGPNPATGGTPAAMVDNFEAIRIRIETLWQAQGWNLTEIYWLMFVSHPVSDPDDAELVAFREAFDQHIIANVPRGQIVDITDFTDANEMLANGWYNSGGSDRNHLLQAGYEQIGLRIIGDAQ